MRRLFKNFILTSQLQVTQSGAICSKENRSKQESGQRKVGCCCFALLTKHKDESEKITEIRQDVTLKQYTTGQKFEQEVELKHKVEVHKETEISNQVAICV